MDKKNVKRVLVTVGTRPEAIKMAPVIKALQNDDRFEALVCATGQHTDMMFPILEFFDIERDFTLDVMRHQQPLNHLAGRLLESFHNIIEEVSPDIVMVQGDTTSAFICAIGAHYGYDYFWKNKTRDNPIDVAHVEAGLRTGKMYSPYPEEMNRRLIAPLARWSFAPTEAARAALEKEGIVDNVYVTGNTVIDALFETQKVLEKKPVSLPLSDDILQKRIILVTGHRRENYGGGFDEICNAIVRLSKDHPDAAIVYPVHLNKNVQKPVHEALGGLDNVHLLPPLAYPEFVTLMAKSHLILTDSGGVQEEAPSLGKPVLVMRDETEREEAIVAGTAILVGPSADRIVSETNRLMNDQAAYDKIAQACNPYGDGQASQKIVDAMAA